MEYGLIGEHLGHSFSKNIHESIESYKYELKEIKMNDLEDFLRVKDFKAINVTVPYKEKVIPYLDEIDENAKNIGAVNIIVNRNGRLIGYNSDVDGFLYLLKKSNIDVKDKTVLILGTGGASKAVKYALSTLEVKKIYFASRKENKEYISYQNIYDYQDVEVIINTTPVGMYPDNLSHIIEVDKFKNLKGFIDIIYNPINTSSVVNAKMHNIKSIGGLYMLIYQAIKSIEIFLDKKIDDSIVDSVYKKILCENSNIVLIGMPSSGKSAIAKLLAKILDIKYIDTDEEIVKRIKMPIKDYFVKYGETKFREIEKEVVKKIYRKTPLIISTGGGIIKDINNIKLLKQNGRIYFINRKLDLLKVSGNRPLSSNKSDLEKLYLERLPLYQSYCDIEIENNTDLFINAAEEIVKYEDNCNQWF